MTTTTINEIKLDQLLAPPETKAAMRDFLSELHGAAGTNLRSVVLYGGLAAGRYEPSRSDINVVIVLGEVTGLAVKTIADSLRKAARDLRVEPMILTQAEIIQSADVFPIKFIHIKHNHVTLFGDDVFETLEIGRKYVRLRAEQELRNLSLRMRRALVTFEGDPFRLVDILTRSLPTMELALGALLMLEGEEGTEVMTFHQVLDRASHLFGLDHDALLKVLQYRQQKIEVENVPQIFDRVLSSIAKAADAADSLE